MKIGIFQLLPRGGAPSDREVIEQGLWEVDFAEQNGFESVWLAEHHFSGYGTIGAPSVYAAAIAQRTKRIRVGYGVAVLPIHHPLRLAEEISWVDHLSNGRVSVGIGPGFSPFELIRFEVPVEQRHARFDENFKLLHRALADGALEYNGKQALVRPRPYTKPHPPFYWAATSEESVRKAASHKIPILFASQPVAKIAQHLETYREVRLGTGVSKEAVEQEIGEMYVLRRTCIGDSNAEALQLVKEAFYWEDELSSRVHDQGLAVEQAAVAKGDKIPPADLSGIETCIGDVETVLAQLKTLRENGIHKVICWFNFGNMPYKMVQRSMGRMVEEIIPRLNESLEP